jgi:hypothetical protein
VLAWCLLAAGDATHAGYYSAIGLVLVTAGLVVTGAVLASGARLARIEPYCLIAPLVIGLVYAISNPTKVYLYLHGGRLNAIEVMAIVTAVAALLLLGVRGRLRGFLWWLVLALAAATGLVTIALIRDPHIDVWALLQQSSTGLLHGDDMYRQHWTDSTGLQAVYPYLPWSTVLLAPFRWITGDVRVGLLAAIVLTAWLVRRYSVDRRSGELVSCLLLIAPGWTLLVNRSWTEPLLVLLIAVAILAMRAGKGWLAVLAFALALASKQHVVFLIPLFALWPSFGVRRTAASIGLAVLGVLPWVIAGPSDFWHDSVHANVVLRVRTNSLDLPAVLAQHGHVIGFGLALALLVVAYAIVVLRAPRTPAGLALSAALVMWAFDLANKQTYFNHYQLPLGLLVVGLALADESDDPATGGRGRWLRGGGAPR